MKELRTTGKIKLADMVGGDGAILKAMATNEVDTITAYEHAVDNAAVPAADKDLFQRGLADERKHKDWMDQAAKAA
jgi:bacterioferritin (cytochrome b1)